MQQSTSVGGKLSDFTVVYSNCSTSLNITDSQVKKLLETLQPGQYMCGTGTVTVFPNNYIRLHDIRSPLGGLAEVGTLVAEMGN